MLSKQQRDDIREMAATVAVKGPLLCELLDAADEADRLRAHLAALQPREGP